MLDNQIIIGKDAIIAAMVAVNIEGKKWQEQVQVVVVSTCLHIHEHGDYRILNSLLREFPKGGKSTALVGYLNTFAPVAIEVKGQEVEIKYNGDRRQLPNLQHSEDTAIVEEYKQFLTDMINTNWVDFKPAKKVSKLDVPKKIGKLISDIQEHLSSPVDGDVIPNAALDLLQLHNGTSINYKLLLAMVSTEMLEDALEQRLKDEADEAAIASEIERSEEVELQNVA